MRKKRQIDESTLMLFEPQAGLTACQEIPIKRLNRGLWTTHKARLIQCYLDLFVYIAKHGTYIDGFAGPQEVGDPDSWSAKLVLESQVKPKRLHNFFLFDSDPVQVGRLEGLRDSLAPLQRRRIEVRKGDFNQAVVALLEVGEIPLEPTFCLLDQRTFECRWSTVEALARYKRGSTKIEMFYFLPVAWLDRAFSATSRDATIHKIAEWWGGVDWPTLQEMSSRDRSIVFTRRFKEGLGYADVKPWPIYADVHSSKVMYYMLHATDHPEAPLLMRRAYERVGMPPPASHVQLTLSSTDLHPPDPPTPAFPEDLFGPVEESRSD